MVQRLRTAHVRMISLRAASVHCRVFTAKFQIAANVHGRVFTSIQISTVSLFSELGSSQYNVFRVAAMKRKLDFLIGILQLWAHISVWDLRIRLDPDLCWLDPDP
jgi:hypothetical protein